MIGMYSSQDSLVKSLGQKIRAVKSAGEKEPSDYFGRSGPMNIRSPYQTWKALVYLDTDGTIIGVLDVAGRWLAKTDKIAEIKTTEYEQAVERTLATYRRNIDLGVWARENALTEIKYQITYQGSRDEIKAAVWRAALEAF